MTTAAWIIAAVVALVLVVLAIRLLRSVVFRLLGIAVGVISSLVMRHYIAQIPGLYARLRQGS